ncbi:dihydropteroate synthase [Gammaproteobacteria bacterium]|nr:dihydropteroate synthase [Gammaproteobacteria bacterium]
MGILNVTPDSFSDGSDLKKSGSPCFSVDLSKALLKAESLVADGADIIDVGGESTRPGSSPVSVNEELQRVIPVIKGIKETLDVCVSVDTSSAVVMMEAVSAGAEIINDVRAFSDSAALEFAAKSKAALCVMHMQGRPASMQKSFHYDDLLGDVSSFLFERIKTLLDAGVSQNRLVIDPGFGFGKSLEHNYQLLKHLSFFQDLNLPIMVGISRKSMIGDVINRPAKERIYGSLAATVLALNNGALIIRTHDVSATVDSIRVHSLYQRA